MSFVTNVTVNNNSQAASSAAADALALEADRLGLAELVELDLNYVGNYYVDVYGAFAAFNADMSAPAGLGPSNYFNKQILMLQADGSGSLVDQRQDGSTGNFLPFTVGPLKWRKTRSNEGTLAGKGKGIIVQALNFQQPRAEPQTTFVLSDPASNRTETRSTMHLIRNSADESIHGNVFVEIGYTDVANQNLLLDKDAESPPQIAFDFVITAWINGPIHKAFVPTTDNMPANF